MKKRSGIKRLILGIVVLIFGVAIIPITLFMLFFINETKDYKFIAPGEKEIAIESPGSYYLWNNFQVKYNGGNYSQQEDISDETIIKISDAKTGSPLKFINDDSFIMSNMHGSKQSVGYVEIEKSGAINIEISGCKEERVFSFSKNKVFKIIGLFLGIFIFSLLSFFLGIGLIIWGIIKLITNKSSSV